MMTSSVVKKANIAGDDVCSLEKDDGKREDSDVDFEASRRSTRVQSKSTIRSALFLAKN